MLSLSFDRETVFINTYFGLGDVYSKCLEDEECFDGLVVDKTSATLFKIPFYNKDNPFFIMEKYCSILYEKISEIYICSNTSDFNPKFVLFDTKGYDFLELVKEHATSAITKEKVDTVNSKRFYCPIIIQLLEESNLQLRKLILKKN